MNARLVIYLITLVLMTSALGAESSPQIMTVRKLEQMKKSLQGKRHLLFLRSLDCPPCFKELALIGKMAKGRAEFPVILFNVDLDVDADKVYREINLKYGLSSIPHYFISEDEYERVKYALDSSWYGELPKSYFIKEDGVWVGRSGLITEKTIDSWLK